MGESQLDAYGRMGTNAEERGAKPLPSAWHATLSSPFLRDFSHRSKALTSLFTISPIPPTYTDKEGRTDDR